MIDHIAIAVSDYQRAKIFYEKALAPLEYKLLIEVQGFAGFGLSLQENAPIAAFWLRQENPTSHKTHIAFKANSRKAVDEFYEAALKAGAKDNGAPGIREMYHPNYYGAFVLDLDGHNIEAVCHFPCDS